MTTRLDACLPLILRHEGGWSDNPADPGGATMKGVTLAVFSDWLGRAATKAELRAISDGQIKAIYERLYWLAAYCDKLPVGLDYMVFDLAVNSGVGRAKRYLQEESGAQADGHIGPKTLAAVKALGGREMVKRISARRAAFYRGLSTFSTFGRGWMTRLAEVTAQSEAWATA